MSDTNAAQQLTMADKADIHELYELSVQNVEHEVEFMQGTFEFISSNLINISRLSDFGTRTDEIVFIINRSDWCKRVNDHLRIRCFRWDFLIARFF